MSDAMGVIFDMDGVLVDSRDAHLQSWMALAEENGMRITDAEFSATFGRTSREAIGVLFGEGLAQNEVARLDDRKEALYRDIIRDHVPLMNGAVTLVRSLHEAGLRLAVGSSGPPANVDMVIDAMGVRDCLRGIVTGTDVVRGKPDPQVFLIAADRLALPPSACVVIEDAPVGVEAALSAGCGVIGFCSGQSRDLLARAHRVVDALSEIDVAMIRSLGAAGP